MKAAHIIRTIAGALALLALATLAITASVWLAGGLAL